MKKSHVKIHLVDGTVMTAKEMTLKDITSNLNNRAEYIGFSDTTIIPKRSILFIEVITEEEKHGIDKWS